MKAIKSKCKACAGGFLIDENLIEIDMMPLVDAFTQSYEAALRVDKFDVKLTICGKCKTLQLRDCIDPKMIYESSSYPKSGWNKNLEETLSEVIKYSNSVKEASILEIGANDGELAKKLIKGAGVKEYTIVDPSLNSKEIKDKKIIYRGSPKDVL